MRKTKGILKVAVLSLMTSALAFAIVGGTVAWLMAKTESVVNVFTYGDINISLEETTGDKYKMVPGNVIEKDPKITVLKESEDCYLFVKIEESTDAKLDAYIEYAVEDGWMMLESVEGVYYREVKMDAQNQIFTVLKDNQVKVKGNVTKEMLNSLTESTYPKLSFTAYAVQRDETITEINSAIKAWELINQ